MKRGQSIVLLCVSSLPFVLELPYAWRAMRISSVERWNWCFALWAVLLAISGVLLLRKKASVAVNLDACPGNLADGSMDEPPVLKSEREHNEVWRFVGLLPALFFLLFGYVKHIHLAILLGGILLPYTLAGCLLGRRILLPLLPSCGLLVLFCPSIGVLLSTLFARDGILLKALCAVAFSALLPILLYCRMPKINLEALLFVGIALLVVAGYWIRARAVSRHPALQPVFDELVSPRFRGVQEVVSVSDRQFFGESDIKRFLFNDQNGHVIQVLVVSRIDNIHQIHPTSYCLRVSGFQTMVEHARLLPSKENCPVAVVLETLAERSHERHLFWQWFSTSEYSTSNFLLFRTLYSPANDWSVFLIDVQLNDTLDDGQQLLHDFISDFIR